MSADKRKKKINIFFCVGIVGVLLILFICVSIRIYAEKKLHEGVIFINGEKATSINQLVKVIEFNDVNQDGFSSGKGKVNNIILHGQNG